MKNLEFGAGFAKLVAACCALIVLGACVAAASLGLMGAAVENGPIEWSQEGFLVMAAVFSMGSMTNLKDAERLAAFLATVLYAVFLLRELEIPETGPVGQYLASSSFRWHETLAVLALVVPVVFAQRRHLRAILTYGLGLRGWPFALAALFVVGASPFDGAPVFAGVEYLGTFVEETSELVGYGLLALAAAAVLWRSRKRAVEDEDLAILTPQSAAR